MIDDKRKAWLELTLKKYGLNHPLSQYGPGKISTIASVGSIKKRIAIAALAVAIGFISGCQALTTESSATGNTSKSMPETFTNSIGMTFVYIVPGTFMMGSPNDETERADIEKRHQVTLKQGFYMQTTEVTQGQWQALMSSNPSRSKACGNYCPVESVSWDDSQRFIVKLNAKEQVDRYRLPSEAEWEYAARAGTQTPFAFGDCLSINQAYYYNAETYGQCPKEPPYSGPFSPAKAGSFEPNAWGLFDMHGNLFEWCQDWYGDYPDSGDAVDPKGPSHGSFRVIRGGSWSQPAAYARSAYRGAGLTDVRARNLGIRIVMDEPAPHIRTKSR